MMREFEVDWWPKRVVAGENSIARLPELLSSLGRKRALVLCGRSIAASQSFSAVRGHLGSMFAGVFSGVQMHAPLGSLEQATDVVRGCDADTLISLGGGSAIDTGKGLRLMHQVGPAFLNYKLQVGTGTSRSLDVPELSLAHIAIPTTTGSGSEATPTCGFRDVTSGHKHIFRSLRLIPDLALLDPTMTVETPRNLTICSSMTAIARSIESLYSGRRNPFRAGLALQALRMLLRGLPKCIASPHDLEARADCQVATTMSAVAANVNTSAVGAVGHLLGGRYGLQHGVPHTILLASGMRMMLPVIGEEQRAVLLALGEDPAGMTADEAGRRAAERIKKFVSQLPLPQKLREVGVEKDALESIASGASHDPILRSSGANISTERILEMLEEVY